MSDADVVTLAAARRFARTGDGKRIRQDNELSLAEMAADVGCGVSTLFRWEKAERRPTGAAAARWVDCLLRLQRAADADAQRIGSSG